MANSERPEPTPTPTPPAAPADTAPPEPGPPETGPPETGPDLGPPVYTSAPCLVRFAVIAALGLAADLWTKHWAFTRLGWPLQPGPPSSCPDEAGLQLGPNWEIIPCFFRFQTSVNPGGIWGNFDGGGSILAAFSVGAMLLVVGWFLMLPASQWGRQAALALILAGAAGNMYDRVYNRPDFVEVPVAVGDAVEIVRLPAGRLDDGPGKGLTVGDAFVPAAEISVAAMVRDAQGRRTGEVSVVRTDGKTVAGPLRRMDLTLFENYDDPAAGDARELRGFERIRRRLGGVRDFIQVHWKRVYYYPIFNVADSWLCIGVGVLLLATFAEAREDFKALARWLRDWLAGHPDPGGDPDATAAASESGGKPKSKRRA